MIQISKPIITEKDVQDVSDVLRSGMIVQGPKVRELEEAFCKYCNVKFAVAVNSGTAALHAALNALGVGFGDEVITSPFTFVATANAILMCGATPVFADIDENTFCIDPLEVNKKITKKTRVILPVSLYGLPYDKKIDEIAKTNSLKVLDDAAQSIGSKRDGIVAGSFGDVTAFSLYATKNIMCGEGGMITTNDEEYAEYCKMFRHHGQSEKVRYEYYGLGYNYRMTDLHAAIGINQLSNIENYSLKRINNANILTAGLRGIKGIECPEIPDNCRHVFHQYTIRVTKDFSMNRDQLKEYLQSKEIGTAIYYPKPLHLYKHLAHSGCKIGDFPVAEKTSGEVLSLPVHPSLDDSDLDFIIQSIKSI